MTSKDASSQDMRGVLWKAREQAKGWETNRTALTENGQKYLREDVALAAMQIWADQAAARRKELVEALRAVEWVWDEMSTYLRCPNCGCRKEIGHSAKCQTRAALHPEGKSETTEEDNASEAIRI